MLGQPIAISSQLTVSIFPINFCFSNAFSLIKHKATCVVQILPEVVVSHSNCFKILKWVIKLQSCIHHWSHQWFCLYSLETIFVTKQYLPKVELHPLPGNIRLLNLVSGSNEDQWCFELQPSRYASHLGYRLWCPTKIPLFKSSDIPFYVYTWFLTQAQTWKFLIHRATVCPWHVTQVQWLFCQGLLTNTSCRA